MWAQCCLRRVDPTAAAALAAAAGQAAGSASAALPFSLV